jgi:hypothetical protein
MEICDIGSILRVIDIPHHGTVSLSANTGILLADFGVSNHGIAALLADPNY